MKRILSVSKISTLKHQLNENKTFLKNIYKTLLNPAYSQNIINALFIEIQDFNLMIEIKVNSIECLAYMTHGLTSFQHDHEDVADHPD